VALRSTSHHDQAEPVGQATPRFWREPLVERRPGRLARSEGKGEAQALTDGGEEPTNGVCPKTQTDVSKGAARKLHRVWQPPLGGRDKVSPPVTWFLEALLHGS
jgi:hypothetical protein